MIDGHWEKRYNEERPGRHAGTHVCAVQKTNISAGPKNGAGHWMGQGVMIMKIRVILLLLLIMLLTSSCTNINNERKGNIHAFEKIITEMGFTTDENPTNRNETRYHLSDLESFFQKQDSGNIYVNDNGDMISLEEIDSTFPVEHLRSGDNSRTYIVYPVEEGGYFLVFLDCILGNEAEINYNKAYLAYGGSVYFDKFPGLVITAKLFVGQSYEEFLKLFPQTVTSYYLSSIDAISYSPLDDHNVVVSFFSKADGILKMKEWYIIPYEESSIGIRSFDIWDGDSS